MDWTGTEVHARYAKRISSSMSLGVIFSEVEFCRKMNQ